jgi:undecaprenyl-diphosphatase
MSLLQAILLGIVQAATEFLPVSSSAHLVIVPFLLGWQMPADQAFVFDVLVQLGTLVAVMAYFWRELWAIGRGWLVALLQRKPFGTQTARLGWYLILATLPAGVLGLLFKDLVEQAFASPLAAGGFLFLTAALLWGAERWSRSTQSLETLDWKIALSMGIGQALAILPGVSRSGATISAGMLRGLQRADAARFSFLMSLPIMLAAGLVGVLDLRHVQGLGSFLPVLLVGFGVAALVGYLVIRWLLGYLAQRSMRPFAWYCLALALLVLLVGLVRG